MSGWLTGLYDSLPAPLQTTGVTLYGLKLYLREYGPGFRRHLEAFERRQWLAADEIAAYQDEQLAGLIRHAYENVPYYRRIMDDRRLTPRDVRTAADLPKLPILAAADLRLHHDELVARSVRRASLIPGHTSGTTGAPLQFLYDSNVCLVKNVVDWRHKGGAGLRPGDPIAFFLGRMVVPAARVRPPFWRTNHVMNHVFFSSFHLSPSNLDTYCDKLRDLAPRGIEGYPSTLFIVASYLVSRGRTVPMGAAFTSSETLLPTQRETIERAFECPVFDFYGLAERVAFATECEAHAGLHLNADFGVTELIGGDGRPAGRGELGRLVATGLHNFAMPLIRYRTSDVTRIDPTPCDCGRGFPRIVGVATKDEDIITTPDGRHIASSILTHPFKPLMSIRESQIIQEDLNTIRVKIVRRDSYSDADSRHLIEELGKRVGSEVRIELEFVDEIPRTSAGKLRWVVSKVPLEF